MLQRVDLVAGAPPAGGDVEQPVARDPAEAGDADIVGDRLLADQAVAAVLRHQAEPERHRVRRGCRSRASAPSTRIVPSRRPGQAP